VLNEYLVLRRGFQHGRYVGFWPGVLKKPFYEKRAFDEDYCLFKTIS
jgi:hypothetical protein